jgi:hypothetical protein
MTQIRMVLSEDVKGYVQIAEFDLEAPREVAMDVFTIALHTLRACTEDRPPEEMVFDVDRDGFGVRTNPEDPAEFVPLTQRQEYPPKHEPFGPTMPDPEKLEFSAARNEDEWWKRRRNWFGTLGETS